MKTLLLVLLLILSGCAGPNLKDKLNPGSCEETIISLGLPEQMKEQGLVWALAMQVGESKIIDTCYKLTRKELNLFEVELLCT